MTNVQTQKLYNGKVSIDYFPDSHRYKLSGQKTYLISVSAACNMLDKSGPLVPWATGLAREYLFEKLNQGSVTQADIIEACERHKSQKEIAAKIGTSIHDWINAYVTTGKKQEVPEDEKVRNGVIAFLEWKDKEKPVFEQNERLVYSLKHDYVGRFDSIIRLGKKRYMVDYKSAKGIYIENRYQTAAYLQAWNEEHKDNLAGKLILHLDKGSAEAKPVELNDDLQKDFECFLALLTLKRRDKELYIWSREVNA